MRPTMSSATPFPKRTVHLDFHTGPWIPDVGRDFNPGEFAETFAAAHVDSVTVFAKCHHGHLYYDTTRPERHPSLSKKIHLLEEQVEALHRRGIRAPIYLSVQCDEYAANTHPEWIAQHPQGAELWNAGPSQVKWNGPLKAGWQIMDMSSPYQDFLAEQLDEVLRKFAPVDGIFMDMCWDQISVSKWAIDGMRKRGYDPRDAADREKYAHEIVHVYMARYKKMVDDAHKKHTPAGVWFNSRPKTELHIEKKFVRHVEVEALPTGGWGYAYFPYVSRFVRPFGLPTLSHTGRFFKSWGDNTSLKPEMALKYECCQILSQGMTGGVGDLLHPRGVPNKAVYELIGKVYSHIEKCEPYVHGGSILSQIALVVNPALGDAPGPSGIGATRALQQLQHQFDVVPPSANLGKYDLVIIPETTKIDEPLRKKLREYLKAKGAVIVCGPAALDENGKPVLPEMGIQTHGPSPYSHTFLKAAKKVSNHLADYAYVMYEPGFRMTPAKGAETLVQIGEPYFERSMDHFSGHEYTPMDKISKYAAAVKNGAVITFSVPLLEAYGKHAAPNYRDLLGNCIDLLLPRPLVRAQGPSILETTVVRKGKATVVHLLCFTKERRAEGLDIAEDAMPLVDMPLAVRLDKAPKRACLAPEGRELPVEYRDGYAHVRVTLQDGHALAVFE